MGRTFRKDKQFRPKGRGQTFVKDSKPWKKPNHPKVDNPPPQKFEL